MPRGSLAEVARHSQRPEKHLVEVHPTDNPEGTLAMRRTR